MHLTTDLTFEPIDEGSPEPSPVSRLLCGDREAGQLPGSCIEAQAQLADGRRLLIITDNVVFTEAVEVALLSPDLALLDSLTVGGAYATGEIENVTTEHDSLSFDFLGQRWTVRVHLTKRILRLSGGLDILDTLAGLAKPRYLSLSSRKDLSQKRCRFGLLATLAAASLSMASACRQSERAEPLRAKPSSIAAPAQAMDAAAPLLDASSAPKAPPIHFGTEPPKHEIDVHLLKTVAREARLVVECQAAGYKDVTPFPDEIYVYLDVACSNVKAWKGKWQGGELHFLWQIERHSQVPPIDASILVFLIPRERPITEIPSIEWVTVEVGLFELTSQRRKAGLPIVRQANRAKP